MNFKYNHLALGGTFDLLHIGHKFFLEYAFKKARKVSVGITTDKMANENGKTPAQNLSTRMNELKKFLYKKKFITRSQIILLEDIYGPTLSNQSINGILVTKATVKGGQLINQKRKELGLHTLPLVKCPLTLAADNQLISSTRIMQGIINREGLSYYQILISQKQFVITENLRQKLSKPQGKLLTSLDQFFSKINHNKHFTITIGDEISRNFLKKNIAPNLAIVDFKINRKEVFTKISDLGFDNDQSIILAKNAPGTIDQSLVLAIWKYFKNRELNNYSSSESSAAGGVEKLPLSHTSVIKVNGEEDLTVIPTVLLAPLSSLVFYGQKDQGVVKIEVTEAKKAEFLKFLKQFN